MANVTIVTSYYKFKSKHSVDSYKQWMTNFLSTVETPMVIFTNDESIEDITRLRDWAKDSTLIINKPFNNTFCSQKKYLEYWKKDHKRDHEKVHNPNLYIVWNEKSKFVDEAIRLNHFKTDFYCWCDIGTFRTSNNLAQFKNFPKTDKLLSDRMNLLEIEPFDKKEVDYVNAHKSNFKNIFIRRNRIAGNIFIAHKHTWEIWILKYYEVMDMFMKNDQFTGKDQSVMAVVALLYPNIVNLIKSPNNRNWEYLQTYLS